MAFKRLRPLLLLTFLLLLFFAGSILLLNSWVQNPSIQEYILEQLSKTVGYEVHAKQIQLLYWKGIGIRARDFEVRFPDGARKLAASKIRLTFSLPQLIRGQIVPTRLTLVRPLIELTLGEGLRSSSSNDGGRFAPSPLKALTVFPSISLDRAYIILKGLPLRSRSMFLRLSQRTDNASVLDLVLNGRIEYKGNAFPVSATGIITPVPGSGTSTRVNLKVRDIPLSHIQLPDLPVKSGTAAIEATVAASPGALVAAKGKITVRDLDFMIVDAGDKKRFSFDTLQLPFEASYAPPTLRIPSLQMKGPGFTLNVASKLDLTDSTNPQLNLMVTADAMALNTFQRIFPSSLLPRWVEARLFPIFTGGLVRVKRFSLNGRLNQIANLDLPKNAAALRLNLHCRKLTAFKRTGGVPVEQVSGNLAIQNGRIRASGIQGRFGDSVIREGTLDLTSLYVDIPEVSATAAGSFRVEDMIRQQNLSLIPEEVRLYLDRFASATGKIQGTIHVGYKPGWPYPRVLKGELSLKDCTMTENASIFPVFLEQGKLVIDGDDRRAFTVKGRWGRSAIEASGRIGMSWETGHAHISAEADMGELVGHFHPDIRSVIRFGKRVPCRLTLVKGEEDWRFDGKLDLKNVSLETESMTVEPFGVKGDLDFSGGIGPGKHFCIDRLTCALGKSSFGLAGTYDLEGEGLFELNISSKQLRLEDLGVRFKKRNLMGKGSLAFDAAIKGSRSHPMMTVVSGDARGKGLFLAAKEFPHPVEECDFALTSTGKGIDIDFLDLKLGRNPFHIEGHLQGWNGMRGDLSIHSDFLDLSDLLSPELLAHFKTSPAVYPELTGPEPAVTPAGWRAGADRFIKRSDIHMDITAPRGQWDGLSYGPLKMACALRSGDLYISRSSVAWEHGRLQLRGHVQRGTPPNMLFSGYMDITKQPLRELPPSLDFVTSRAEGQLTMEALLFTKGTDADSLISNLAGSVNVLLEQGVLKKSHAFIKILDFMSLQGMFIKRPSDLSKDGLYFERIGAHVDLTNGLAKTQDVSMRSPVFNAAAVGEADLCKARINAEIGIQPLGTLDALVSSVPVAGYLLTGDKKALYVDYFKVEGEISDPDVRYIPLKSLGNGTVGFLTRVLLSPTVVLKRITEAARDFEGNGYPVPDAQLRPENDMGG